MQVGQQTTFTDIYRQFRPGPLSNADQHLRLTGTDLHVHNPLMPHGKGAAAAQARQAKYDNAADAVKTAIAQQYSPQIADRVFQNLGLDNNTDGIKLRDLRTIKAEIERQTTVDLGKYGHDNDRMLQAAIDGTDVPLAEAFDDYGRKWLSSENFDFLRAIHDYREAPTTEKARAIVGDFIDGSKRLNPTDDEADARILFNQAKQALEQNPADPRAFDDLYKEVFEMTARDIMPRFAGDQRTAGR